MERLSTQLEFLFEVDRLKSIVRRNTLMDGSRRENSAEHSWYLAVMALTLGEHAPPGTDLDHVVRLVLVHDLVEIDADDTFVYDEAAAVTQAARERAAADRIFALLPPGQGGRLRGLWEEFEERRTPEARFARALDRLAPMLANFATGGGTWVTYGITADQVLLRVRLIEEGSPALGRYARDLVAESVARGYLAGTGR